MKLIEQSYEILDLSENALQMRENAGRTCYKSEDKITEDSAVGFVKTLISRGHHAMIEFGDITVRFITNRGVSHELVRHRLCSFAQESTRYVRYSGDMEIIKPVWWENSTEMAQQTFIQACTNAERCYRDLLDAGRWSPQQAREVLPNALKTEIVMKGNIREWRHIFTLRCAKTAHPQMFALMRPLLAGVQERMPVIFDDIKF
jgi:thymidylate synthase (FAD)